MADRPPTSRRTGGPSKAGRSGRHKPRIEPEAPAPKPRASWLGRRGGGGRAGAGDGADAGAGTATAEADTTDTTDEAAGAGGADPAPRGGGGTDPAPLDREYASGSVDDPDAEHDGDEQGEDAPRWGGGDVALGILASVLAANITLLLALSLSGVATFVPERGFDIGWAMGQTLTDSELEALPTWGNLSIEWRLLGNVGLWVGLVGVTLWAVRSKGSNLRDDLGLRFEAGDVPLGLVVGAIGFGAVQLLMWPIAALVGSEAVSAPARSLSDSASGPLGIAALIVMVVVIAPFVEELFYRGLALRAFTRRMGERWGLVASALVFAALHLQDLQFPALVLVGLGCGYLAQRYGRLGPAIFAHVGYNAVNVAILVWVL